LPVDGSMTIGNLLLKSGIKPGSEEARQKLMGAEKDKNKDKPKEEDEGGLTLQQKSMIKIYRGGVTLNDDYCSSLCKPLGFKGIVKLEAPPKKKPGGGGAGGGKKGCGKGVAGKGKKLKLGTGKKEKKVKGKSKKSKKFRFVEVEMETGEGGGEGEIIDGSMFKSP